MKTFIYSLTDPITNQIRYVGKTVNLEQRLYNHINHAKTFDEYLFKAYINKLPESESLNMIKIIYENKLPDCKFKAHLDKWFKL